MRPTFAGIEIGKTGIFVSQYGLDVTGHNIANVDTKGYTRQRIVSTAYDPYASIGKTIPVNQALVGGGVRIQILDQIRVGYLDRKYRTEATNYSYWNKRAEGLTNLEAHFDNVREETSVSYALEQFFGAVKDIGSDTVGTATRTLLQENGANLAKQLNDIYESVMEMQGNHDTAVTASCTQVNIILKSIMELNKAIYQYEITGHPANDLRDKRNVLIDDLAEYVDIEYEEYPGQHDDTMFKLKIGGVTVVDHDQYSIIDFRQKANTIQNDSEAPDVSVPYWRTLLIKADEDISTHSSTLNPTDAAVAGGGRDVIKIDANEKVTNSIKGGELLAHMQLRDNMGSTELGVPVGIPYYIELMNNLARALYQEVNEVHRQGWTQPLDGAPSMTGVDFFGVQDVNGNYITITDISEVTAKNIALSSLVASSEFNVAASSSEIVIQGDPLELQAGNNENINSLYNVFLKKTINLSVGGNTVGVGSLDGYVASIRFQVGLGLNESKRNADNSNNLVTSAQNQRLSVSGVSLDEEMTQLIKYQHAYSGASRVITAMDEALDVLINRTGRVGL